MLCRIIMLFGADRARFAVLPLNLPLEKVPTAPNQTTTVGIHTQLFTATQHCLRGKLGASSVSGRTLDGATIGGSCADRASVVFCFTKPSPLNFGRGLRLVYGPGRARTLVLCCARLMGGSGSFGSVLAPVVDVWLRVVVGADALVLFLGDSF